MLYEENARLKLMCNQVSLDPEILKDIIEKSATTLTNRE